MKEDVKRVIKQHAAHIDHVLVAFEAGVRRVVSTAQSTIYRELMRRLKLDAEQKVIATPGNQRVLQKVPGLWIDAVSGAGLDSVLEQYMAAFPSQVPAFLDLLRAINYGVDKPVPLPKFSKSDHAYLSSLTLAAGSDIGTLIEQQTIGHVSPSAFTVGMATFAELTDRIFQNAPTTLARAETLADTSIQSFYRAVAARGYEKIQKATGEELRYRYFNPRDVLTRKWCIDRLNAAKPFTRKEIQELPPNAGNLDPFIYAGGYRCRGQWALSPD